MVIWVTYFIDLLVVALFVPVMPIVNKDYLNLVLLYVSISTTQLSIVEILTTALYGIQTTQGQRVRLCLHVQPKQGEE